MKRKAKIFNATGKNVQQIEDGLTAMLNLGWEVVQFFAVGTNSYIILQKTVVE